MIQNIDRGVYIPVVSCATRAIPKTILEIKVFLDGATVVTGLRGRIPAVNLDNGTAIQESFVLQNLDKLTEGEIRDLATPELLHAFEIQVFDTDDRILKSQRPGGLKEPVGPTIYDVLMHILKFVTRPFAVLRSLILAGEVSASHPHFAEVFEPPLRRFDLLPIAERVRKVLRPKSIPTALPVCVSGIVASSSTERKMK